MMRNNEVKLFNLCNVPIYEVNESLNAETENYMYVTTSLPVG